VELPIEFGVRNLGMNPVVPKICEVARLIVVGMKGAPINSHAVPLNCNSATVIASGSEPITASDPPMTSVGHTNVRPPTLS
jgi:hypothetical protein